jgi:hypothetical protein
MPMASGAAVSSASAAVPAPPAATAFSPQDRDPLYREFLEWRASRSKGGAAR